MPDSLAPAQPNPRDDRHAALQLAVSCFAPASPQQAIEIAGLLLAYIYDGVIPSPRSPES